MYLDSLLLSGMTFFMAAYVIASVIVYRLKQAPLGYNYAKVGTFAALAKKYIPFAILGFCLFIGLCENNFASNSVNAIICSLLGMSLSYEVFGRRFASISVGSLTYLMIIRSMDYM